MSAMSFHLISNRFFTVLRLMIALIFCTARTGLADDPSDLFNQGKAEARQKYYTKESEGTHTFITIDGKKQRVHFDGQRWLEVTD
jgi:hypothetical protein